MAEKHSVMQDQKTQLRRQFHHFRDGLGAALRAEYDLQILARIRTLPELLGAKTVFCYISSGSEADTRALLEYLLISGKQIAVPKITGAGEMTAIAYPGREDMQVGEFGIPVPISSTPFTGSIDVCITPGLAFTPGGIRLGQGLGYYDRWFAAHPVRQRIALAYECQITDKLPADTHDIVVSLIITEQRIIRVS